MNRPIVSILAALFAGFISVTSTQASESCAGYPYLSGKEVESTGTGLKILATAAAPVSFSDVSSVRDAREEAELEAKAMIAKFLAEEIKSDSAISRTVNESISMRGESKEAVRNETVQRLRTLRNSAQALLRGVVILGGCHTPGSEVRVTVGLKPETTAAAETISGQISGSISRQPAPGQGTAVPTAAKQDPAAGSPSAVAPVNRSGGYSDTDRIRKF